MCLYWRQAKKCKHIQQMFYSIMKQQNISWLFCINKISNNMVPLEAKRRRTLQFPNYDQQYCILAVRAVNHATKSNIVRHNYPLFHQTNAITYWQGRMITGNYQKDNPYGNVLIIKSSKCTYSLSIYFFLYQEVEYLLKLIFISLH